MPYVQSRIERVWNGFGFLLCLAAVADVAYWRRNVWEGLLLPGLSIVDGNLFARLIGIFPHAQLTTEDKGDESA
jgi:hypothetical protein